MADQDRSRHQLEEAPAAVAAEAALAHIGDRMTLVAFCERLVAGRCRAAKVPHRDGFALQKGRSVHTANLGLRAWRRNREKHVKQGLAAGAARALDREQPPLGDAAAVRRDLVRIAAGFEHAMASRPDRLEPHRAAETNKPELRRARFFGTHARARNAGEKARPSPRCCFGATDLVGELPRSNGQTTAWPSRA